MRLFDLPVSNRNRRLDAIIDPRRPNAQRYGRGWLVGMVAASAAVSVLLLIGLMALIS